MTRWSRIPQIALLRSVHQKFKNVRRDTDTHTKSHSLAFVPCARQQLCLVQVEEQLMNQTTFDNPHLLTLCSCCWPCLTQSARDNTWLKQDTHTHTATCARASVTSCKDSRQPPVTHTAESKEERHSCCTPSVNKKALALLLMSTSNPSALHLLKTYLLKAGIAALLLCLRRGCFLWAFISAVVCQLKQRPPTFLDVRQYF